MKNIHGEKAVLAIDNNILKFKAEVPEILYYFRFLYNQDGGLDYIPNGEWAWEDPFDIELSVSYEELEVDPFIFKEPVKFDLELNVNIDININEVIKKMTSDFRELQLSDDLESDLRSAIQRWWNFNYRKYLKTQHFNDGIEVRISSLISLDGYLQVKKDLLEEAGVTDSDSTSVKVMKIIRHISMANMWKKYDSLQLDNNDLIVNMFGKYMPNIVFVLKNEYKSYLYDFGIMPNDIENQLNIHWDGSPSIMYGKFWISKKGSKCFTPTSRELATHILVKNDWGGAFDHTRGREYDLVSEMAEYSRLASSNGGGIGYSYYVLKTETSNVITIDDI